MIIDSLMKPGTDCKILITILFFFIGAVAIAQVTPGPHIDPSKPTNLYTRLGNNLEYTFLRQGNRTFGYRANFVWASASQKLAAYVELPLLYATSSNKFGLSDIRLRYFWLPYKNYSKTPASFGFTIDSYLPTGSFEDGLGRGRWIVAPGLSTGFVLGKFSTFPIFSYLYASSIQAGKIPGDDNPPLNGYIVQSICVFRFSKKSYVDCTPIFIKNSYTNAGQDDFILEGNYLYMVKQNKMQVGCFVRRIFEGNVTTVRAAMRLYF